MILGTPCSITLLPDCEEHITIRLQELKTRGLVS